MRQCGWTWLLLAGLCVGSIPACLSPAMRRPSAPPFTGELDYRATQAAIQPIPVVPGPVTGSSWSPYNGSKHYPIAGNLTAAKSNLPERPSAIGFVKPAGEPLRSTYLPLAGSDKPQPALLPSKAEVQQKDVEPAKLPLAITQEPAVISALRRCLDHQEDQASKELSKIDPQSREVLMTLLPLTAKVSQGGLNKADPKEVAAVVDQLQGLLWSLRPRAALVMDKFCFCRQIKRFGVFEALDPSPTFHPGEIVEVYAEIRNVSSQPLHTARGDYQSYLRSALEIRREDDKRPDDNRVVWAERERLDRGPEQTLTPQHDFFQHYRFQIPALEPGKYSLHLEVCDVPTGRKVRRQMSFVVGTASTAARSD